jgi:AAA15 family ATPase/GTPase
MIRTLSIENFRGIQRTEIPNLSRINLFFGKNNCGKSSLLEAIFILSNRFNPTLALKINELRHYYDNTLEGLSSSFYNRDTDIPIHITSESTEHDKYLMTISTERILSKEIDDNAPVSYDGKEYRLNVFTSTNGKANPITGFEVIRKDGKLVLTLHNTPVERQKDTCIYMTPTYPFFEAIDVLKDMIQNKQKEGLILSLQSLEPSISDIAVVGKDVMVDVAINKLLPVNILGDGIRKILSIILNINACKGGMLLIDEVDNGFHFTSMTSLWQAILSTALECNTQIFVTTHNIDSLKSLNTVLSKQSNSQMRQEISAYKLIKKDNAELVALRYGFEEFSHMMSNDIEIR